MMARISGTDGIRMETRLDKIELVEAEVVDPCRNDPDTVNPSHNETPYHEVCGVGGGDRPTTDGNPRITDDDPRTTDDDPRYFTPDPENTEQANTNGNQGGEKSRYNLQHQQYVLRLKILLCVAGVACVILTIVVVVLAWHSQKTLMDIDKCFTSTSTAAPTTTTQPFHPEATSRGPTAQPCRAFHQRTCYNGGMCMQLGGATFCQCPAGYVGSRCETEVQWDNR